LKPLRYASCPVLRPKQYLSSRSFLMLHLCVGCARPHSSSLISHQDPLPSQVLSSNDGCGGLQQKWVKGMLGRSLVFLLSFAYFVSVQERFLEREKEKKERNKNEREMKGKICRSSSRTEGDMLLKGNVPSASAELGSRGRGGQAGCSCSTRLAGVAGLGLAGSCGQGDLGDCSCNTRLHDLLGHQSRLLAGQSLRVLQQRAWQHG